VQWALVVLSCLRRRKALTALVFLAGLAACLAYYLQKPRTYRVEARVLVQRQQALPSAVRSAYEDVPTRSAWDIVHRRENLLALVRAANLAPEGAVAPLGLRDTIERRFSSLARRAHPTGSEDPVDTLVTILDKHLVVSAVEGTITIALEWGDPQQAYDVVSAALQNFLDARHIQEVTAVDEVIAVLKGHATALRAELEAAQEDARKRDPRPARPVAVRQQGGELGRLQSLVESKQRAIQDVEEFRRRRLADLQTELDRARNTLSDQHPTLINLRNDIRALSRESPQLDGLREEERNARREYAERLARDASSPASSAPSPAVRRSGAEEDDSVRHARLQYEEMVSRVTTAEAERDAARAAFKYRYNVIWPPQLPREPVSPSPKKIFGVGVLVSLMLAFAAAVAPDVLRGRVVERWQVEDGIDLPVIGDLRPR
jgi:uncharacterized protein involved in exopolysaccharide biosynthesis